MVISHTWPPKQSNHRAVLWESLQGLHPLTHFSVALVRKMFSGLVMQHSRVARLNNDVMSTVKKCFVPSSGLCSQLANFFPNTTDCLDIFWMMEKYRMALGYYMNQSLRMAQTREVSGFFSCIHFWLFFLGFCYYYDKLLTLSLGFLHSNSMGKR